MKGKREKNETPHESSRLWWILGKEPSYKSLLEQCSRHKKTIADFKSSINDFNMSHYQELIKHLYQEAESSNKDHSYLQLDNNGKVIASTPAFRKRFGYENVDEILGVHYSHVLRVPPLNGNSFNWVSLTGFLQDLREGTLNATILDRKNKTREVYLEKQSPKAIKCYELTKEGAVKHYTLAIRRIDIHDIGFWRLHKRKRPKDLQGYIERLKLEEFEALDKEFKKSMKIAPRLIEHGLIGDEILLAWDNLKKSERSYTAFKKACAKMILEKRKKSKSKKDATP